MFPFHPFSATAKYNSSFVMRPSFVFLLDSAAYAVRPAIKTTSRFIQFRVWVRFRVWELVYRPASKGSAEMNLCSLVIGVPRRMNLERKALSKSEANSRHPILLPGP